MKLSTRARYGVRFMLDLALGYGRGAICLKGIAERQQVSEKYLWNIIDPLRKSGLINSIRGSEGGYVLAKPPSEINLRDVVYVLEGPMCLVDCVEGPSICECAGTCVTRDVWAEASASILQILESVTLGDMVERQKSKALISDQ